MTLMDVNVWKLYGLFVLSLGVGACVGMATGLLYGFFTSWKE